MLWHQFGQKLLSALDFDIYDSIIVINLTTSHFSPMDQNHVEESIDNDQGWIGNVRLHIDRLSDDVPVVLQQKHNKHDKEERAQLPELEGSAVEGDHEVEGVGHQLRLAIDQVLVARPDQHEDHYWEYHWQVKHSHAIVDLASANFEQNDDEEKFDEHVRHTNDDVDV